MAGQAGRGRGEQDRGKGSGLYWGASGVTSRKYGRVMEGRMPGYDGSVDGVITATMDWPHNMERRGQVIRW